ncbi:MAG: WG repeat-containing protein [Bacteroidetes bacterium]|nr:WG repeat-containing protein [Bacteroidota bacterium]
MKKVMSFCLLSAVLLLMQQIQAQGTAQKDKPVPHKPSIASAIELRFDDGDNYTFHEGLCSLKKNELWGFIDTTGKVVIDYQYFRWGNQTPFFSSGIALVSVKNGYMNMLAFIDKKGQSLFKSQKYSNCTPFYSGVAIAEKINETSRARTYNLINKQGQMIPGSINPGPGRGLFHTLEPFQEGMTKLYDSKKKSIGFITTQGKWVAIPGTYSDAGSFSEGLVAVQNTINYYWGFINVKGEVKVPFDYRKQPGIFSEDLAAVENSQEMVGYIDATGKTVLPFNYHPNCYPFKNGHAVVYVKDQKAGYAIIDKTGNIIRRMGPDPVQVFDNGWIYYKEWANSDWMVGILSPDGKDILVPGYFNYIGEFSNGLAYASAKVDNKYVKGFINRDFDFVIIQTF